MCGITLQTEVERLDRLNLLESLLQDKTSGRNILWATDAYASLGDDYGRKRQVTADLLVDRSFRLMSRVEKDKTERSERTKSHAEVFTPLRIVKMMNDYLDEAWFGYDGALDTSPVFFPEGKTWQSYVNLRCLEIACGEAPYLVTRYDVASGETVALANRMGILDRKLRVVAENTTGEEEWLDWAFFAYEATYGYEFQGDNLLIARVNLLKTFEENLETHFGRTPSNEEYEHLIDIITWNTWQMDGQTMTLPYYVMLDEEDPEQPALFSLEPPPEPEDVTDQLSLFDTMPPCKVFIWQEHYAVKLNDLKGHATMKFDFIIGNPPYQEDALGDNKGYASPIYNKFMDESFNLADHVELIHPARFLFNAGSTPKAWNRKMLNDPHLKVLLYEPVGSRVFPNTDIKGGIAITYHDTDKDFGAIGTFIPYDEINSIMKKAAAKDIDESLTSIVFNQTKFNLDILYKDYPELREVIGSNGKDKRFRNNIFEKISLFTDEQKAGDDITVLGVEGNKRIWKHFPIKYVDVGKDNLFKWKALLSSAMGSGVFGEALTMPIVLKPGTGHTQSFRSIGAFDTEEEANACCKYVRTKFARALLGILKITQDTPPEKWRYVPMQNFTAESDIDWFMSVQEIDQQLYKKYKLDEDEIAFIESHVKEMR